ncbi:ADP-ribosylglycohydrolase family protein [Streptomyces sp. NPDC006294]|uniref:ADP-ribosylglycohydrolase family protein n=1 Tax=Streptomyces sp. NPDC006294 TaxID=3364743 RepID=UPI003699260F
MTARQSPVSRPPPAARAVGAVAGSAVPSRRRSTPAAIDLGGDTDTVAAVTGALAGAAYGIKAGPRRWTEPLHVPLPGFGGRVPGLAELTGPAVALRHGQCIRPGG